MSNYLANDDAFREANQTARDLGLTPVQFALKFVESRAFTTSNIIGATTMEQLKSNIDAHDITWTDEMEAAANALHEKYRCPLGR